MGRFDPLEDFPARNRFVQTVVPGSVTSWPATILVAAASQLAELDWCRVSRGGRVKEGWSEERTLKRALAAVLVVGGMLAFVPAASAGDQGSAQKDYSQTALNIIPSGQYGTVPPPSGADTQALMYDGLTPLFDNVTNADLTQYFKSEKFGIVDRRPRHHRERPAPGRDDRPRQVRRSARHLEQPRRRRLGRRLDRGRGPRPAAQQARYNARVAAIDAPGLDAIDLIAALQNFQPSDADRGRWSPSRPNVLRQAGPEGEAVLHDIDIFCPGDQRLPRRATAPRTPPFTRERHLRAQRAQGPVRRRGRRRRGAPLRSSSAASSSGSARRRATASSTTCARTTTRAARPRSTAQFNYEHAPTKPGARAAWSSTRAASRPRPPRRPGRRRKCSRGAAPGQQRADDRRASTRTPAIRCSSAARRSATSTPASPTRSTCTPATSTGAARPRRRSPATC